MSLHESLSTNSTSFWLHITCYNIAQDLKDFEVTLPLIWTCRKGKNDTFQMVTVNRERVRVALKWLKKNNHLYSHINISDANLQLIPESGVLSEKDFHQEVRTTKDNTPEDFISKQTTEETEETEVPHNSEIDSGSDSEINEDEEYLCCDSNCEWTHSDNEHSDTEYTAFSRPHNRSQCQTRKLLQYVRTKYKSKYNVEDEKNVEDYDEEPDNEELNNAGRKIKVGKDNGDQDIEES